MAQIRINGITNKYILVSTEFIRKQMLKASGDHIKVYLMLLDSAQSGTAFDTSEIADIMETTEKDIIRSLTYWQKAGIITLKKSGSTISEIAFVEDEVITAPAVVTEAPSTVVPEKAPVKQAKEQVLTESFGTIETVTDKMAEEVAKDDSFHTLREIANHYFKKPVLENDLDKLILFYYRMGKDFKCCEYIIEYCAESRKNSINHVDRVSCECIENGYTNYDSIKQYLGRNAFEKNVIARLGLSCSSLSTKQRDYLNTWINEYRFSEDMINEACDRASQLENRNNIFSYVEKMLSSWYAEGVTDKEALAKKDEAFKADQEKKYAGNTPKKSAGTKSANSFNNFEQSNIDFSEDEAMFFANHIKKQ